MSALVLAVQNLLADALIALFTFVNARWDVVALLSRWFMGDPLAVEPAR